LTPYFCHLKYSRNPSDIVRAMFADQRDVSGDVEVLEEFGLDVLNQDTIKGYRIIFEQLHSGHPWNAFSVLLYHRIPHDNPENNSGKLP